jgi:hypothetical protein
MVALLSGCAGVAAGSPARDSEPAAKSSATASRSGAKKKAPVAPKTAPACAAAGGTWRTVGMLRQEICDMPTHDAGKPCTSSSECESICVAPADADLTKPVTGTCYRSFVLLGTCLSRVEQGRVDSAQCAD